MGEVENITEEHLRNLLKVDVPECWLGTDFEHYVRVDPKKKGMYGEKWVSKHLTEQGYTVKLPKENNGPFDRYVVDSNNTYKVEIKFSVAGKKKQVVTKNHFTINHVSIGKSWDRLVFAGINPDLSHVVRFMHNYDLQEVIDNGYMYSQQGGKSVNNDDYMCTGNKLNKLLDSKYMHDITNW